MNEAHSQARTGIEQEKPRVSGSWAAGGDESLSLLRVDNISKSTQSLVKSQTDWRASEATIPELATRGSGRAGDTITKGLSSRLCLACSALEAVVLELS